MNRDLVFGAAGLAGAAGYYLLAGAIPRSALADAVGPQGLPKSYALVLAALSLILIVRSARRERAAAVVVAPAARPEGPASRPSNGPALNGPTGSDPGASKRPALRDVAVMLAIGVVYLLVVPWLGYLASLAGLILATTWHQGGVMRRSAILVAVSGAIFFWALFVLLLRIPHPAGIWAF